MSKKPRILPKPQSCMQNVEKTDPVTVFCRIKPPDNAADDVCVLPVSSRSLKLTPPVTSFAFRNGSAKEQMYRFQHVFPAETSQKELFDHVAKPLVADLLNGKNGLLFAYGITGSGKTYTMEGTRQQGGILPRSIDVIFNSTQDYQARKYVFKSDKMNGFDAQSEADAMLDRQRLDVFPALGKTPRSLRFKKDSSDSQESLQRIPETSRITSIDEDNVYAVFVNYIEIYNNYIYDLLEEFSETNMTKDLQSKILREDAKRNMYVHGCTEVEVKSPEEAFEVLAKGQKRRKVAHTSLNCESSRSHSIFTIRIVQAPLDARGEEVIANKSAITVSQLSLVDLAGSERNTRTKATGDRIKEAGNINNSLMALRQCIEVLRENQINGTNKLVPYRDSKVTHYFKNYFVKEGKVNMVVCVNPRADDYDETLPVMKFAELASEVQIQRPASAYRQDFGLAPGRRKANLVFKEVRRRLHDEGLNTKELQVIDLTPIYTLGPDWPPVSFTPETFEEVVLKLKLYLEKRITTKENLKSDLEDHVLKVRARVVEMEKENLIYRQESSSYRALYEDALKRIKYLENKLVNAESVNDSLHRRFIDLNTLGEDFNKVCEERDMAKSHGQIEKQRMKTRLKAKLESEKERMTKDMNNILKEQKNNLKIQMYNTQVKALHDLFVEGNSTQATCVIPNTTVTKPTPVKHTKSDPKLNEGTSANLAGPAVSNPRHRRSQSQGASLWLDHHPGQVLDPGTILQPILSNKKSVKRIKSGDLLDKKTSNYCLTTQNQDAAGQLKTKLYKGDVLPTVGGGAQVVFQDVEILQQRDPLNVSSGKRNSDGTLKVNK